MRDMALLQEKVGRSAPGRAVLWIFSMAYAAVIIMRRRLYSSGILKSLSLPAKVVCFGNLTTGGTGKTSAVMMAASRLVDEGFRVAILTRGYRRPDPRKPVVILSDGQNPSWSDCGDEAWMMYQSLRERNVPVLVSPDRHEAGLIATGQFRSQVLLLDDGFQHFRLRRDLDIVLIDARNPFGGGRLLPLGRLREPRGGIRRAGLILVTHCDQVQAQTLKAIREEISAIHPRVEIMESVHHPEFFLDLCRPRRVELKDLKGPAVALSAIGDPESFEQTLISIGLKLKQIWRYPDHHPFSIDELRSIQSVREDYPLITTFKDFPRFPEGWRNLLNDNVYALSIKLKLSDGDDVLMKNIAPAESVRARAGARARSRRTGPGE